MQHHEDTLAVFVESARAGGDCLAIILIGSVARGAERSDSDVDVYVVVPDETFSRARSESRLSFIDTDASTYEHGYVDVKLVNRRWLQEAAQNADEPTRASLIGARVVWSALPEVEAQITEATAPLPDDWWTERVITHTASFRLFGGYFLPQGLQLRDAFLISAASSKFAEAVGRAVLAKNRRLFAGIKYVSATLRELGMEDQLLVPLEVFLREPTVEGAIAIMTTIEPILATPLEPEASLGRFVADHEFEWLWKATSSDRKASSERQQ